jgi:hypothetical protein
MMRVEVRGKVPGGGGEGLPDVLVDLEAEVTTARELIRLAVTEQVRLLRGDAARCRRALDRQYLSAADIREEAARPAQARPRTKPVTRPAQRKPAAPRDLRQPPGIKTDRPHRTTAGNQAAQDRSGPPAEQYPLLLSD